jgi:type IV secretory pathway TraG/TraD family ATPase VirD4
MRLGETSSQVPVNLSLDGLRRHVDVIGKSGVGKSVLMENVVLDIIEEGGCVCVLDPHGDLVEKIADTIPAHRINDIIYWEPFDLPHSISYNPLDLPPDADELDKQLAMERMLSAFTHIWRLSDEKTPRLIYILKNSLLLLLDNPGSTLLDINQLLIDVAFRDQLLKHCTNEAVSDYWNMEFAGMNDRLRSEAIASVQNKTGTFASNPVLSATFGHKTSLNLSEIMNGDPATGKRPKILLVNLAKGRLGKSTSSLIGALLVSAIAETANSRMKIPPGDRIDFTLVLDEMQNFATTALAEILSEARKLKLSLLSAHQFMRQIPEFLQDAVVGTANTTIVFRCGANDAADIAPEFGLHAPILVNDYVGTPYCEEGLHTPQVLTMTPAYHAWLKTVNNTTVGKPMLIHTFPPRDARGTIQKVRNRTWACWARPA